MALERFSTLPIAKGYGDYHVNQFRVCFQIPKKSDHAKATAAQLFQGFLKNFEEVFNGKSWGLTTNKAEVSWGEGDNAKFRNGRLLDFVFDLEIMSLDMNLPDVHHDWVYIGSQWDTGFAVQTLRREYRDLSDWILEGAMNQLRRLSKRVKGEDVVDWMKEKLDLNRNHFLAGRRSWVIGVMDKSLPGWKPSAGNVDKTIKFDSGVKEYVFDSRPVFYLETAAIERSSSKEATKLESDVGFLIHMRKVLDYIWLTLLYNYVDEMDFELVSSSPTRWQKDDGDGEWVDGHRDPFLESGLSSLLRKDFVGLWHRSAEFETESAMLSKGWVNNLIKLHPYLGAQLGGAQAKGRAAGSK